MSFADVSTDFDGIRARIQLLLAMSPTRQTAVSLETALLVLTSTPRPGKAVPSAARATPASADELFFELDLLLALAADGAYRRDAVICRMWLSTAQRHWRAQELSADLGSRRAAAPAVEGSRVRS